MLWKVCTPISPLHISFRPALQTITKYGVWWDSPELPYAQHLVYLLVHQTGGRIYMTLPFAVDISSCFPAVMIAQIDSSPHRSGLWT